MKAIATTYLEADAASVEFSSIPQTFQHLQLRYSTRSNLVTTNHYESIYIRFGTNGGAVDTGTNYSIYQLYATQTTPAGGTATGQTGIYVAGFADAGASPQPEYGPTLLNILDYADDGNKNTSCEVLYASAHLNTTSSYLVAASGQWINTGEVDMIKLSLYGGNNFVRGSSFTLYGMSA
jgi:hypothetical protein